MKQENEISQTTWFDTMVDIEIASREYLYPARNIDKGFYCVSKYCGNALAS